MKQRIIDFNGTKVTVPTRVKCNCGHPAKDHYQNSGWCHHSKHENPGACGCTWFWPNDKWILKQQKKYGQ